MFYLFIILVCIFLINYAVFYSESKRPVQVPDSYSYSDPIYIPGYYNYEYLDHVYYPNYYPYPYLAETEDNVLPMVYYPYVAYA